jgi:hypothetical protein
MTDFFYLLASLPELYLDKAPPITHDLFLTRCEQWLSQPQQEILGQCRHDGFKYAPEQNLPFALAKWMDFEHSLRLFFARNLAEKAIGELPPLAAGLTDSGAIVAGGKVMAEEDPLDRAKTLMEKRWSFLSGLLEEKLFGLDAVCIYSLKLELLEKAALWDREAGLKILGRILEQTDTDEYEQQN